MADDQNDPGVSDDDANALLNVGPDGKAGSAAGSSGGGDGSEPKDGVPATDEPDWKADAERWKKLSRQNEKNLRDVQAKLKEFEDKDKTETQRLQEARDSFKTAAETAASELARMNTAAEFAPEGATLAQLRKVAKRLRGDTPEELEADAKELWEDFAPASKPSPTAGKPKERLKSGGADPEDEPDELDPRKIVANIPRAR